MAETSSTPVPRIRLQTAVTASVVTAMLLGFVMAVLLLRGARISDEGLNHYVPVGYQKQVLGMIERPGSETRPRQDGPLQYQPVQPGAAEFQPEWGQLEFDETAANPGQRKFFQLSNRLQNDIAMFNETGDGFFQVGRDGGVMIAPYFHNFALPYPLPHPLKYTIAMAGEKLPSLIGEGIYFGFAPLEEGRNASAQEIQTIPRSRWVGMVPGAEPRQFRGPAFELRGRNGLILRLVMTGDHVQMEIIDTLETAIYLNGERLNRSGSEAVRKFLARSEQLPGKTLRVPNAAPLVNGDRLRIVFHHGADVVALRFGRYSGGLVTRTWMENGRLVTEVDPELEKEWPYVGRLHRALNRYAENHPNPESLGQPNFRVTLNRDLHRSIRNVFLPYVRNFDARLAALPNTLMEPASVSVVDAVSGEVLAMPSYPAAEDLEILRTRARDKSLPGLSDSRLRRLSYNQNLLTIPIGSTTKPLFAAAIWETHPELRRLVVNEDGSARDTLHGYKFFKSYGTVARGRVDSTRFLQASSNDYTINLAMLMLAKDVRLGRDGRPLFEGDRADFSDFLNGDLIKGGLYRPTQLPAFPRFAQCFDVNLVRDLGAGSAADWNRSLLDPVFQQLRADGELLYRSFSDVLPEQANLDLNKINSVRGNFVSLLLGSGTNRWSNLMLAQAYARLGTGRMVECRLVQEPEAEFDLDDFDRLPISDEVLGLVHSGMSRAVQSLPDSTASRIADSLQAARNRLAAKGLKFYAIGKTGTAMRISAAYSKDGRKRECAAFCLYLEIRDARDRILAATSTSTYLQDRAEAVSGPRNSSNAVQCTEDFLPHILSWMESQPEVRQAAQR